MKPLELPNFREAITQASHLLQYRSKLIHSAFWQGTEIANRPEMATHEVTHVSFCVPIARDHLSLPYQLKFLADDIAPNLPWADDHFEERVCGQPINPGVEWENWPYNKSAATFLDKGQFNHNYMERYWPKFAGAVDRPTLKAQDYNAFEGLGPTRGIRYEYGDLSDVVKLLATDPYTRQAYLPVWFPEDTGGGAKRAPCTIGYHFLMRDGRLDINYEIRSCDFLRHFRDDIYLTVRLLLWVLQRCQELDERWKEVRPGKLYMQIGSLHLFRNDYQMLYGLK